MGEGPQNDELGNTPTTLSTLNFLSSNLSFNRNLSQQGGTSEAEEGAPAPDHKQNKATGEPHRVKHPGDSSSQEADQGLKPAWNMAQSIKTRSSLKFRHTEFAQHDAYT